MKLPSNPKVLILASIIVLLLIGLIGAGFFFFSGRFSSDKKSPELYLTNLSEDEWLNTNEDNVTLKGVVLDESDIKDVTWKNQKGDTGKATITGGEWVIQSIPLSVGDNQITVTATDSGGNTATSTINVVYNTDVLFSDLTLSQDFIYKDEPTSEITTRGSVATSNSDGIGKVHLYRVDNGQNSQLSEMLDNGVVANGDDIPGDTVFSGIESFSSSSNDTIQLRIGATVGSSSTVAFSGILEIKVLNKPTQDQISDIFDLNKEFSDRFEELKKDNDAKAAAQLLVDELSKRSEIEVAGVAESGFGVWWKYKDTGILAGINNNPEGTKGKREEARAKQEQVENTASRVRGLFDTSKSPIHFGVSQAQAAEKKKLQVKSTKALYLGPYFTEFGADDDYHKGWQVIKDSKCPECQTTEKKDGAVTVEDFKTLSQYGIVMISSHGDTWFNGSFAASCSAGGCPASLSNGGGFVVTWTNQKVTAADILKYLPDLVTYRLAMDASDGTLAVMPPYISSYNGSFPNSVIYVGTCRSTHNATMAAAYLAKGAKAYLGFSEYVLSEYAGNVGEEFFKSFKEKGKTVSEAFKDATDAKGASDGGGPGYAPAFFNLTGSPDLEMGGREIQNGSFEEGLVGWQAEGDSRVINRLASLTPQDGKKMAIISTGLGSVNNSKSALAQTICIVQGKLTLSFKYDFVSEEPLEYVGSQFDDNFTMTVTINGKKTVVVQKTINNSKWVKIGGINFAGGDSTTYHTGWKTVTKDLGEVKADEKVEIEFRVGDKGDSIYDSAALIDAVKLEIK